MIAPAGDPVGKRAEALPSGARRVVRLGIGAGSVLVWSGTASAHGGGGYGGPPIALPVVLWVPVVAGLIGGVLPVCYRALSTSVSERHRTSRGLGLLLVVLGGTAAIAALAEHLLLGAVGGYVGAATARWFAGRQGVVSPEPGHHADLAFGVVFAHRFLEGVALGTLYLANAAVGAVGAAVVAGHAALETAAVGGLYAPNRLRGIAAAVLVQIGYPLGAVAGLGVGTSIPAPVRIASIGVVGGILLVAGVEEMNLPAIAPGWRAVPE